MKETYAIALILLCSLLLPIHSAASEKAPGFHWNVGGELRYEDNVYRTLDKYRESDTLFVIRPELVWLTPRGKHLFDISYSGEYAFYFDVGDLDYDDHHLRARARLDHSYRLTSEFAFGYMRGHDIPGSTDSVSLPFGEPNKWWNAYGKARVAYGRDDSKGQLVGQLSYHQKRYTNNGQVFRDYNLLQLVGTFYLRIAPKTRMLFEADWGDYSYQNDDRLGYNQTNREYHLYTGVTWDATAKTSGTFKLGYRDTNYDDSRLGDLSGLALWLEGTWKPNTYTKVTFGASQDNQASAQQFTNGYVRRHLHVGIEHGITPRTLLTARVLYGNDTFEGPGDREDGRWYVRLGARHSLRRWLDLTAEYQYEERDSNFDIYDYSTNIFLVGLKTRFQ